MADEFRRTACLLDERRGVQRVLLGLVIVLFPIQVVQKAHDAPELLIFRVVLAGEVAHGLLDGLAVLDMERILVVGGEQLGGLFASHAGGKCGHGRLLSFRFSLPDTITGQALCTLWVRNKISMPTLVLEQSTPLFRARILSC